MANELQAVRPDLIGSTLYTTLDGRATNNPGLTFNATSSAYEAATGADWAHYAVPMTDANAVGKFWGSIPPAIPANTPLFGTTYKQLGSSPAPTDAVVAQGDVGTAPVIVASNGLDSVPGYGSWSHRQTLQVLGALLAGLRSGLPTPGQAGSATLADGYGTISWDANGDITAVAITPPA